MNEVTFHSTPAYQIFSLVAFVVAAGMMAGGIYFLEASFAAKGFYAMSAIMLVHTTVTVTKTLRDVEEARRQRERDDELSARRILHQVGEREVV